jgi:hypothetical protein
MRIRQTTFQTIFHAMIAGMCIRCYMLYDRTLDPLLMLPEHYLSNIPLVCALGLLMTTIVGLSVVILFRIFRRVVQLILLPVFELVYSPRQKELWRAQLSLRILHDAQSQLRKRVIVTETMEAHWHAQNKAALDVLNEAAMALVNEKDEGVYSRFLDLFRDGGDSNKITIM